ncbi:gephyrin-like molybdotransferase Glp [Pontibacillus salicampi]|uniref:Molybdopterin molybdenumtransferase n=1 Tax=Pontibacillus salicampi TaxID=1449801 RepID=A0ABV6LII3_9BACI
MEPRQPIAIDKAIELVMQHGKEQGRELVSLQECDDRYIAEDIYANHPIPPFPKSPYDGFAFRSEDTASANRDNPVRFTVVEHVPAGATASRPIGKGEAVRIMTGAAIPEGADCVAMFEVCHTYNEGDLEWVELKRPIRSMENVMDKGSETEEGALVIRKGTYMNPGVKAVLATFGFTKVPVTKKPKIGLITTGTELLDVEEDMVYGKIRNSNGPMIAAQCKRAGADFIHFGKLMDELEPSYERIQQALKDVDILITTGGVSVGDFDLMPAIYEKLEAKVLFNKVAMRPGSVTTVAVYENKMLFGLSGNPSACYVGFELFARPIIRQALGTPAVYPKKIEAYLGEDFEKPNPFTRFVRGKMRMKNGFVYVEPVGMDKSAVVTSLSKADVFIVLRGGTRGYKKGDMVEALWVDTQEGQRNTWNHHLSSEEGG